MSTLNHKGRFWSIIFGFDRLGGVLCINFPCENYPQQPTQHGAGKEVSRDWTLLHRPPVQGHCQASELPPQDSLQDYSEVQGHGDIPEKGPHPKGWQEEIPEVCGWPEEVHQGQSQHPHVCAHQELQCVCLDHLQGCERQPGTQILYLESQAPAHIHHEGEEDGQVQKDRELHEVNWWPPAILLRWGGFAVDMSRNRQNDRWICKEPSEVHMVFRTKHLAAVMVLGVISSQGHVMPPHFFNVGQKVNKEVHMDVLEDVVKPWMDLVANGA